MPHERDITGFGALLPAILQNTPLPVWVVENDGTVFYANPAALQLLGYDAAEQVLGRHSHEVLHPQRPDGSPFPRHECRMLEPLTTGEPLHGDEEWFLRTDGAFVPVSWSSAPIDLPGGRGVVHSFVDLTARFELERQTREREIAESRRVELLDAHLRLMESIAEVRRQIVRDLHDGAQQRLVALALEARLLRESLRGAGSEALALLDGVVTDAQGAIDDLRELAAGIHPSVLTSRGLLAAVRSQADRCTIPVVVRGELGDHRLPPLIESNAYFFVAEALTNAAKYSQAERIDVGLTLHDDVLSLEICDDGIGGVSLRSAGTGLHSMHDRVHAFDGVVEIHSPRGGGTRIRARVPVVVQPSR